MLDLPPSVFQGICTVQRQSQAGFSYSPSPVTSSGTASLSAQPPSSAAPAGPAVRPPPEVPINMGQTASTSLLFNDELCAQAESRGYMLLSTKLSAPCTC